MQGQATAKRNNVMEAFSSFVESIKPGPVNSTDLSPFVIYVDPPELSPMKLNRLLGLDEVFHFTAEGLLAKDEWKKAAVRSWEDVPHRTLFKTFTLVAIQRFSHKPVSKMELGVAFSSGDPNLILFGAVESVHIVDGGEDSEDLLISAATGILSRLYSSSAFFAEAGQTLKFNFTTAAASDELIVNYIDEVRTRLIQENEVLATLAPIESGPIERGI